MERFTVSLAEICLYETVNNESNTNNRILEFEIKQSNLWPIRTIKTQIVEPLNNEKCETTGVEQRRSLLISIRLV